MQPLSSIGAKISEINKPILTGIPRCHHFVHNEEFELWKTLYLWRRSRDGSLLSLESLQCSKIEAQNDGLTPLALIRRANELDHDQLQSGSTRRINVAKAA
jgi:hypothetical protein